MRFARSVKQIQQNPHPRPTPLEPTLHRRASDDSGRSMAETILLEEANPHGTRVALVEDDGRTVYLYLSPAREDDQQAGEVRAVWVRNRLPAPDESDLEAMREGQAPLRKKSACKHPDGAPALERDELDLVWFPDGCGVTLYRGGEVEAILPPFYYSGGANHPEDADHGPPIYGYAREAAGDESDAGTLPLPPLDSPFFDRLQENLNFWTERARPEHWPEYRDRLLAIYEAAFGKHQQYYALEDRAFPIVGVAEFECNGWKLYASVGMGDQDMPGIEGRAQEPERHLRAEVVMLTRQPYEWAAGLAARMALYPWLASTFVSAGHSFESGLQHPDANFVFTRSFDRFDLPAPEGPVLENRYPLNLLLAAPVPQDYLRVVRVRGAEHVLDKVYG